MKKIKVNNQRFLQLENNKAGIKVITLDNEGNKEKEIIISDADIVMLLNYYMNCKEGIEESDYIK